MGEDVLTILLKIQYSRAKDYIFGHFTSELKTEMERPFRHV